MNDDDSPLILGWLFVKTLLQSLISHMLICETLAEFLPLVEDWLISANILIFSLTFKYLSPGCAGS